MLSDVETAMTDKRKFKQQIRARMERTNESYMAAKRALETGAMSGPAQTGAKPVLSEAFDHRRQFRDECLAAWKLLTEELSGGASHVEWTDNAEIIRILNLIATRAPRNHTHFPESGGLDLTRATTSREPGCIEIRFDGQVHVVRPSQLSLTLPKGDPLREWAYFWLETLPLAPSGVYQNLGKLRHEEVLEVRRGEYIDRSYWNAGSLGEDEDGDEIPIPPDARVVTRHFEGSFLILTKGGGYNAAGPYGGEHSRKGPHRFREFVEQLVEQLRGEGLYGLDPRGRWSLR